MSDELALFEVFAVAVSAILIFTNILFAACLAKLRTPLYLVIDLNVVLPDSSSAGKSDSSEDKAKFMRLSRISQAQIKAQQRTRQPVS